MSLIYHFLCLEYSLRETYKTQHLNIINALSMFPPSMINIYHLHPLGHQKSPANHLAIIHQKSVVSDLKLSIRNVPHLLPTVLYFRYSNNLIALHQYCPLCRPGLAWLGSIHSAKLPLLLLLPRQAKQLFFDSPWYSVSPVELQSLCIYPNDLLWFNVANKL